MLSNFLVAVIVVAAMAYSGWRFMPRAWRARMAVQAGQWVADLGASEATARRVATKLDTKGTCGSCDTCKACATPAVSTSVTGARVIPIRSHS